MYNITVTPYCLQSGKNFVLENDLDKAQVQPETEIREIFSPV